MKYPTNQIDFDNLQINIVDQFLIRTCKDELAIDQLQAWDRIKDLARKGMVAEKYTKEWEQK